MTQCTRPHALTAAFSSAGNGRRRQVACCSRGVHDAQAARGSEIPIPHRRRQQRHVWDICPRPRTVRELCKLVRRARREARRSTSPRCNAASGSCAKRGRGRRFPRQRRLVAHMVRVRPGFVSVGCGRYGCDGDRLGGAAWSAMFVAGSGRVPLRGTERA